MFKIGLVKTGIQILTGLGVGALADEGLKLLKPKNLTGIKKMAVNVGSFVISSLAAEKAMDYVEDVWNSTAESIRAFVAPKEVIIEEEIKAE